MSNPTLDRPLAGYCRHGEVIALTIDATPERLADFIARYRRVKTVENKAWARSLPWCDVCVGGER